MKDYLKSIYTDGSRDFVSNPLPKKGEEVTIKLRVLKNEEIKAILFRTKLNGVEIIRKMEKVIINENDLVDYYQISIKIFEDMLHYHFYICADQLYYYNQRGLTTYMPNETYDFKILTNYQQPSWVKEGVFYQIFPERFCNGNPDNDVKTNEYYFDGHPAIKIEDWNTPAKRYNEVFCLDFYGGDLEGITKKIPYLKELGVTALYLNPIFYAATMHKYDCLDYFHVDPHFGGDEALEELSKELHKNGMKLILDVSINHTGIANKWFNKEGIFFDKSIGAYNNKNAKEREYYFFKDDNSYKAWFDVETLPTLNYTSENLRKKIYKDQDSLVKKWLKAPYNIDGWRFDVADVMARNDLIQLHHEIWPEIRKSIKEENSDAYILAEDWCDSTEFQKGNEWDSPMNYFGFCRPVRDFLGEGDIHNQRHQELKPYIPKANAETLAERIKDYLAILPFAIQENQFNLLDSHDAPRLHNNKAIPFEHYRGAIISMFSIIGTPSIYYGDEMEIDGFIDETEGCRYPMPWEKDYKNNQNYKLYSALAKLKQTENALKYGGMQIISTDDNQFIFARTTLKETIITIFNMYNQEKEVKINPAMFNLQARQIKEDLLKTKLETYLKDNNLIIKTKPNTSYIIKL